MLDKKAYIQLSLMHNLFWLRIMKEHMIFAESSMLPPQKRLAEKANCFIQKFDKLLFGTIKLANGYIPGSALESGQYYTRYTEIAEKIVHNDTKIIVNSDLTRMEYNLEAYCPDVSFSLEKEKEIDIWNQKILDETIELSKFKKELLDMQTNCQISTNMYTSIMIHIWVEAEKYIEILHLLQNRDDNIHDNYKEFWIRNMSSHAKAMRGLYDPSETEYIEIANQFSHVFDSLLQNNTMGIMNDLLKDTEAIRNFKAETTYGIIECKIQAIMQPLLTDHFLRETNHFIYLMNHSK